MEEQDTIHGALGAINARMDTLPESERKIATFVFKEAKKTLYLNVRELARQCGASQAAVVRFCKRSGFSGFAEFKLRLARDVFRDSDERFIPDLELESESSPGQVIHAVVAQTQRSLSSLETTLDPALLGLAAERIMDASTTVLFGVGASGVVAFDFLQKLARIGLPASYSMDSDLQLTTAASMHPADVAFIVSYSGENEIMGEVLRLARGRGATIVSLTMSEPNTIRSQANIALLVPPSERIYRQGAATSRINQLAVIDMLYSIMVSRTLDESIEAIERSMVATHRKTTPKRG